MDNYGLASVSEFLGDMIVYRNLQPMDRRLPDLKAVAAEIGLAPNFIPRKSEPDYARVMSYLLECARSLDDAGATLERLVYVGDTQMNDGTAFRNLCRAGGWTGIGFIGSENHKPLEVNLAREDDVVLYLTNRWSMLEAFDRYCRDQQFTIDSSTAIIIDLDKTALGARGRNDHVIDQVRIEAVRQTVASLLGNAFDLARFEASYNTLNRTEFHPFTGDNQDYVAYLCLILGSGLFSLSEVVEKIRSGQLVSFTQFLESVEAYAGRLPGRLRDLHDDINERVQAGDPTPFKAFRYNEYRATVQRMGYLGPDESADALLANEIVITQEVREIALRWRNEGALLFGLSDKPDEASLPPDELAFTGHRPVHRTPTHAVGGEPQRTVGKMHPTPPGQTPCGES